MRLKLIQMPLMIEFVYQVLKYFHSLQRVIMNSRNSCRIPFFVSPDQLIAPIYYARYTKKEKQKKYNLQVESLQQSAVQLMRAIIKNVYFSTLFSSYSIEHVFGVSAQLLKDFLPLPGKAEYTARNKRGIESILIENCSQDKNSLRETVKKVIT